MLPLKDSLNIYLLFTIKSVILWFCCSQCSQKVNADLKLKILHNNDFHSHFSEINEWSSACDGFKKAENQCFGGAARTVALVQKIKSENPNVLFLNGGDHFQGTLWYSVFKSKVVAKFVNLMAQDAMAVGNHEFDDGVDELAAFLNQTAPLPLLSCNLDVSNEPKLQKIQKSIIKQIDGVPVAIIGYTTPDTTFLANPGKTVTFEDEIESIKAEIGRIKQKNPKINIFVALGHSGYAKDVEIAERIPEVDVVVGGHTNTFLWNGPPPSTETPVDGYPKVVRHATGDVTLVVQAFAYGKYLGKLDIEFDDDGRIQLEKINPKANPILLDSSFPEDGATLELVRSYQEVLDEQFSEVVGTTVVSLQSQGCREQECNLGNLMADAFVDFFVTRRSNASDGWTDAAICLINSGSIRSGIGGDVTEITNITKGDVKSVVPFANVIGSVLLNGSTLLEAIEHSVSAGLGSGRFLQFSGVHVTFDMRSEPKVQRVLVRCADCRVPRFEPLDLERKYRVLIPEYLAHGGDDYQMLLRPEVVWDDFGENIDFDMLSEFIVKMSPLTVGLEERIVFIEMDNGNNSAFKLTFSPNIFPFFLFFLCSFR